MATVPRQGVISSPLQTSPQAETDRLKGVRGWLAVWCVGTILFHLQSLWSIYGAIERGNLTSEWVSVLVFGLSAFGIFGAVCVLLVKPYALQMVFLNFLQWAAVLILAFPVGLLTQNPDLARNASWQPLAMFIVGLGIPWVIWFRYFKVSKRVLATFGRNM
jgi:hypothetical protein